MENQDSHWVFDDGGREAAGHSGRTGDCVTRAFAIATQQPYQHIYDAINEMSKTERVTKRKRGKSSARTGVYKNTIYRMAEQLGLEWVACTAIGVGCKVHLKADELPKGRIICNLSRHSCAVVDGIIHDIYDPSRDGTRCVYGFWRNPEDYDQLWQLPDLSSSAKWATVNH